MQTSDVIEIRAGAIVLKVAPDACGAITRFAHDDGARCVELLRPALETAVSDRDATAMSCFPLVPFSNRIGNGRFVFQGRTVTLPPNFPPESHAIHGHGWQSAWTTVAQTESSLTIEHRHTADAWPYPYLARQHFALSEGRLDVQVSVMNEGTDVMPVGFGLHPFFVRTPGVRLQAPVTHLWKTNAQSLPSELVPVPADLPLAGDGLDPNAVALDTHFVGFGGYAEITWPEFDAGLRLEAHGPFSCLVVFTPPAQTFFCAEPATNTLDAFNLAYAGRADTGMLVLAPGQEATGTVGFIPRIGPGSPVR